MKLLQELKKKPFCNEIHLLLIAIILLMVSFKYYAFFALFGVYLVYLWKRRELFLPALVLILLILAQVARISITKALFEKKNSYEAYCIDVKNEDSYYVYIGASKLLIYDYDHNVTPGDSLTISLKINEEKKSYETDYDSEAYLLSKGCIYSAKATETKVNSHGASFYAPKYYYLKYLKEKLKEESYDYVSAMVFGNNNLEENLKEAYSLLGISHILAISGLHILFIFKILSFLLLKLFKYYDSKIQLVSISIYVLLIGAPASCLRALLFLVLGNLNKRGRVHYTKLDILSLSCIGMMIFQPYLLYSSGFLLSFVVSFILIFAGEIIGRCHFQLEKTYKTYFLIFLSTFPIVINFTNTVSVVSLILSPLLSLLISYVLIPVSYLLAVFPVLDYFLKYIYFGMNLYVTGLKDILILISVPSFTFFMSLAYYLLFGLYLVTKVKGRYYLTGLSLLLGFMVLVTNLRFMNPYASITYTDCGQGDAILVRLPHDKGIMVIDAYHSYDYLKSTGIDTIDYLVLTHSDADHIGDYEKIISHFKVKKLLYPKYDKNFEKLLENVDVKAYGITDAYSLKSVFEMKILGPINEYQNVNSNSIVVKLEIENHSFLFTGDMTKEEEGDLLKKYGSELKSEVLKVGHHGSDTSSSEEFLKAVSPKYSIISVGKDNSYGLPDKEVLERIQKISSTYLTYECGNITIQVKNDNLHLTTYS